MLESLVRRPRGRRLAEWRTRLTGATASGVPLAELERRLTAVAPLEDLPARRGLGGAGYPEPGPVTRGFLAELGDWAPDLGDPSLRRAWEGADAAGREYLRVMLAVWQGAPGFRERTGLSAADPPPEVHAMARGPLAAGGGFGAADTLASALLEAGVDPAGLTRALDFGGSSGRIVRVLAAAYPGVEWHACDPNAGAIAWAREHLPAIAFAVSPQEPPLAYDDGAFDFVYAISVWSHLSEPAALRWFAEMHRLLRPGCVLVVTTQGWHTTHHLAATGDWSPVQISEAIADLYTRGHHFRPAFGKGGDHGVASPDWGMGLFTPEWALARLTPAWELLGLRPGGHEGNQDVLVLRRR